MPAPSVSGRILLPQGGQRGDVDVDDRPDLHPHVVHVELGAGGAARHPRPPDRLEAVLHRALGVRERGDVAVVVADDGELADLGQRDQPAVGGVLLRHALVEQDVLGRLDPGDVEVAQPPEVEPATDHRVHAAGEVVLGDAALVGGPEREVADRAACRRRRPRPRPGVRRWRTEAPRPAAGAARSARRPTREPRASAGRGRPRPRRRYAARRGGGRRLRRGRRPGSSSSAMVPTVDTTRVGRSSRM